MTAARPMLFHSRARWAAFLIPFVVASAGGLLGGLLSGCKKKVTTAQCDELLDRYASLVVGAKLKDASPEVIKAEQARERSEAQSDDNFKNCTSELSTEDYACAMAATTADAFEKCLE
jgi:hypothetical protein